MTKEGDYLDLQFFPEYFVFKQTSKSRFSANIRVATFCNPEQEASPVHKQLDELFLIILTAVFWYTNNRSIVFPDFSDLFAYYDRYHAWSNLEYMI